MTEYGGLKPKWLPIQAVHTLWNGCAYVVLSGNVTHEGTWKKWRETGKPDDWKIMTKVEHTKRTAEYVALLERENPKGMRKVVEDSSQLPPIARPAALSMSFEPLPEDHTVKTGSKKRRKRRKPAKPGADSARACEEAEDSTGQRKAHESSTDMFDASKDVQSDVTEPTTNKKKRKRRKSGKSNDTVGDTTNDVMGSPADDEAKKRQRR